MLAASELRCVGAFYYKETVERKDGVAVHLGKWVKVLKIADS